MNNIAKRVREKKARQTPEALFELFQTDPHADQRRQRDNVSVDFFRQKMIVEYCHFEELEKIIQCYINKPNSYDFVGLFNKDWAWKKGKCMLGGGGQKTFSRVESGEKPGKDGFKVKGFDAAFDWYKRLPRPEQESLSDFCSTRLEELQCPYKWGDWSKGLVQALLVRMWTIHLRKVKQQHEEKEGDVF